ncbi:MAG: hypothetical protein EOM66_12460, partial [Clostridia bacterium]|nr:hypothetical protein [Clostridia bacterium]
ARIAYVSDKSGMPQIYIYVDAAEPARQLTNFPDGACQPDWSPDGERIIFISPCPKRQDQYPNASMFILNTDGSGLTVLQTLPGGDFEPAWSPDGEWIAFESLRIGETWIWKMDRNGEQVQEISPVAGSHQTSPAWSPDNTIMYYSKGVNLPQLAARTLGDTTATEVIISEVLRPIWDASISPDGQKVLFESLQDDQVNIYWMPRSGSSMRRLTDLAGTEFDPVWEPTYLYD